MSAWLGDYDNITRRGKDRFIEPEEFSEQSFDAVAFHRITGFFAYHKSQSRRVSLRLADYQGKILRVVSFSVCENSLKLGAFPDSQ